MREADDRAITTAAEYRRAHASGQAYATDCACDDCMAYRVAELRHAIKADARERWTWWKALARTVFRSVMR